MSAAVAEAPVTAHTDADTPDVVHLICHCTDDNRSACGLDVTEVPYTPDRPLEEDCALCLLAWPDDVPTCPWGCSCEECAE